jgi:hypothetical protein
MSGNDLLTVKNEVERRQSVARTAQRHLLAARARWAGPSAWGDKHPGEHRKLIEEEAIAEYLLSLLKLIGTVGNDKDGTQ